MTRFRLAVALAVLASASVAAAQGAPSAQQYMSIRLGMYSPQTSDMDGFNTGFAGDVSFGYRPAPNYALELGVGYFRSATDTIAVPTSSGTVNLDATMSVIPITATAKLILPLGGLEPYAAIGVGAYMAKMEATGTVGGQSADVSDDSTNFGIHFGAGLLANLSDNFSIGADLRYVVVKAKLFDVDGSLDGFQLAGIAAFRF